MAGRGRRFFAGRHGASSSPSSSDQGASQARDEQQECGGTVSVLCAEGGGAGAATGAAGRRTPAGHRYHQIPRLRSLCPQQEGYLRPRLPNSQVYASFSLFRVSG